LCYRLIVLPCVFKEFSDDRVDNGRKRLNFLCSLDFVNGLRAPLPP
jgi:hypothetical protein